MELPSPFEAVNRAPGWLYCGRSTHVWAPYYTLHKIMAGLLDQYEQRGSSQAMDVLLKMASYLHRRIAALREKQGAAWWAQCLQVEFGGMNEASVSSLHTYHSTFHFKLLLSRWLHVRTGRLLLVRHHGRSTAQAARRLVL